MKKTLALIIGLCLLSVLAQAAPDGVNQNLSVNSAAELADIFTGGLSSYYDELEDGDICWVISPATLSWRLYIYDSDSAQTEDGERYVTPDETSTGNAYSGDARWVCMSTMQAGSDGDFFAELSNNTAIDPDASKYQMYFDNGEFKVNENGTEKTVANLTDAQTFAGAQTMTGGIASIGAASNLSGGIVTLGTLGGTIVVPTGATLAASGSGTITATALAASTTLTTPNIGAATGTSLALGADPADAGALRLSNATAIAWEDATEASITHVDNTGWLINAAHVFRFRDSAISVGSADDGHLDLTADTSIDLNGAVVLSSTLDVSGGAITLQNDETIGNGDDTEISFNGTEALALDLDTGTANQVRWQNRTTSTTDVTEMNFSALNLATTGTISGKVPIVTIGSGRSITSAEAQGSFVMVTAAGTYTLPAAGEAGYGSTVCIYVRDASETVVIEVDNADKIRLYATALDAGDTIDSPGAAGNFVCLMAVTDTDGSGTDGWITLGASGTWTDGGAT